MFRSLLFAICAVRAEFLDNDDVSKNSPKGWLENLQRRLMIDNYDYQASSSDEVEMRALDNNPPGSHTDALTEAAIEVPQYTTQDNPNAQIQFVYDTPDKRYDNTDDAFGVRYTDNSLYLPHNRADDAFFSSSAPKNAIDMFDDEHGISRNDVQTFMSNEKKQITDGPVEAAPKNVSYKMIQPSLLSRRAGGVAPRFVEEVGADGIALLSVDGAPFPDFQLPSARRQYQVDQDSDADWVI